MTIPDAVLAVFIISRFWRITVSDPFESIKFGGFCTV